MNWKGKPKGRKLVSNRSLLALSFCLNKIVFLPTEKIIKKLQKIMSITNELFTPL